LYAMLAETLARRGFDVTVVAATPHYPTGRPPPNWRASERGIEICNGVRVVRVRVPSLNRLKLWRRLIQFAAYQLLAAVAVLREPVFDDAIISNPALQTFLAFRAALARTRGSIVFAVADVYPQVGERLGIFRSALVRDSVGWLERYCYRHSTYIRTIARSFEPLIVQSGGKPQQIRLIYDWVDTGLIVPLPRGTALSAELGLDDKFVVQYAGNIGLSQGLELLVEVAAALKPDPRIRVMFVGDGAGRTALQQFAADRGADNVMFVPFQPRGRLAEVLATADVAVVSLQAGLVDSIPSKLYSILASGRPAVVAVDPGNDAARIVVESGGGIAVLAGDAAAMVLAIKQIAASPAAGRTMGERGRKYVETHHSAENGAAQFEELFSK
jgi:colanic acid biosynthesis glycosyl transferase WcaI